MKSRILLIDDSMTIHRVIDLCVDKEKYDVQKVFTKEEAVSAFQTACPDLVLLDNKLTETAASDMVAMIKESCPNCYVVLLAGAFDHFDKEQCIAVGADDFLFKPFDAKTLDAKIICGLEGICTEEQPEPPQDVTDDEMDSLMGGMNEEIEVPPFEEEEELPKGLFDGLKEADEDEILKEEETPAQDAAPDMLIEAEAEAEPESLPEAEPFQMEQGEGTSGVVLEDFDFDSIVIPDDPEPVDNGNLFDGLVEADEMSVQEKQEAHDPIAEAADAEPADELDDILDGINEESDTPEISETIEDVEEALAEDAMELASLEETEDAAQMALYEMDGAPKSELDGLMAVDEMQMDEELPADDAEAVEMPEELEIPEELEMPEETEIPEELEIPEDLELPEGIDLVDDVDALITETAEELMPVEEQSEEEAEGDEEEFAPVELGEEEMLDEAPVQPAAAVPSVAISHEKLVEAVFEAIDEDTLKYAVKEVLTDKISRILEEELPILVERAIRKEIERLVKGNKGE